MQLLGAPIVEVRARMGCKGVRTGCGGVVGLSDRRGAGLGLTKGDGGLVERKSLTLGMGPIDLSVSVAQSNCRGSCGVALCAV
jgi:hypothetical protein